MSITAVQILGISAGLLTSISSVPQLIKIIREKQAKDVSLKMLLILLAGLALWVTYGILKKDIPIIAMNSLSFVLNTLVLILRVMYGDK